MKAQYSSSFKARTVLLVLSLLTTFLSLELILRTYDMARGHGFFSETRSWIAKGVGTIRPFRTFGLDLYRSQDGKRLISSCHGELFTIEKPGDTFRIVVFGGSTTENRYSFKNAGVHYPLALQAKLRESLGTNRIEVINVAYTAYATPHSLILFELDAISWQPDLVIVSHNINDLLASYWPAFTFDYSNKYQYRYYLPDVESVYTASNILFQRSELYWLVRSRMRKLAGYPEIRRRSYGSAPPQLAVEVFKRNLGSFIAIAKHEGIRVVLGNQSLQPSEDYFKRHMAFKSYNSIVTYPIHDEFVHHHRAFNEAMRHVAEDAGVLFVDNDSVLGGNREFFVDFIHYTPDGVDVLASNYAESLKSVVQLPGSH